MPLIYRPVKKLAMFVRSHRLAENILVAQPPIRYGTTIEPIEIRFPPTKFMGSKQRILRFIFKKTSDLRYERVLDAFSGSGCVAYEFKKLGKSVETNDFLHFAYAISKATIENKKEVISARIVERLLQPRNDAPTLIQDTFANVFFKKEECAFLDSLWLNISEIDNQYVRYLALAAAIRACQKKYPRGIFTVTHAKGRDDRQDFKIDLKQHFINAVNSFNHSVFDNHRKNVAHWGNIMQFDRTDFDLVYLDPPYWSRYSDNDYIRRYHFIEGFTRYWKGLDIDKSTKSRKFKSYPTPFAKQDTARRALQELFEKYSKSIIVLSYSSNCYPSWQQLYLMLKKVKRTVEIHRTSYTYSFGNQGFKNGDLNNRVKEFLFIAR